MIPPPTSAQMAEMAKACKSKCPKVAAQAAGTTSAAASSSLPDAWLGITPGMLCPGFCAGEKFTASYTKDNCISACSTAWAASMSNDTSTTPATTPASPAASGSHMVTVGFVSVVVAFFMALLI